ncbi:MAG: DUF6159 family protein [Anaerolineae bacterium]
MFSSWSRSWELVKASWAVLRSDKELIVFPIVSFIGSILVMIAFAIPSIAAGLIDNVQRNGTDGVGIAGLIVAFLFYLVLYTVIFFANTALVGAAMIRLQGGDPTLSDGFRIASQRFGKIVGYALISATVGMILRALSERSGLLGRIIISIIGFVWSTATFLVVPVLAVEDIGPIDAVKRSAALLKKTWGEQIVATSGMGLVFFFLIFGIIVLGGILAGVFSQISGGLALLVVLGTIVAVIALGLISSALSGIYQAALYRYATEGEASSYFPSELVQGAFTENRSVV